MTWRHRGAVLLMVLALATVAGSVAQGKPALRKPAVAAKDEGWRITYGSPGAKVLVEAYYPINAAGGEGHEWVKEFAARLVAAYPGKVRAIVYDFASPKGGAEWQKHGLSCGAFTINGKVQVPLKGKLVTFTRSTALSGWTFEQLKAAVGEAVKAAYGKSVSGAAAPASTGVAGSGRQTIVSVAVPCGLAGPYGDLARLFHARSQDVRVSPRVNGVVALLQQFRDGRYPGQAGPPEVYLALGTSELADLHRRGRLVDMNYVKCARIPLAIIVHKRNPANIRSIEDLASPDVRTIATYSFELSGGRGARQILQNAKLWDVVSSKTVTPKVPDQAKQMVKQRKADAAIVYSTCLMESYMPGQPPVRQPDLVPIRIDQSLYEPIHVGAVLIRGARHTDAARKFLEFLKTPEAQKVWLKWGFEPPV